MSPGRELPLPVLLFGYVLPVLGVAGLLWASGLPLLAGVLVGGEVVLSGIVILVRRRPQRPRGAPSARPWLVPLLMVLALLALVGIAILANSLG